MAEETINLEKGDNPIPRIRMSEIGTTGLKTRSGLVYEEARPELRHPNWNREVKAMQCDAVVSSGVELLQMWLQRATPEVIPHSDEQSDKDKAIFLKQCMEDMEHSWDDVMKDVTSYIWYGFSPIEMVWRKRLTVSGSKYNDGLIGWKKLPIRSQNTIEKGKWTPDGRELTHLVQNIAGVTINEQFNNLLAANPTGEIEIPVDKLMQFRYNGTKGDPFGRSPLKSAWHSWRTRTQLQSDEAIGVQRDLSGVPKYTIPAEYMSPDADDDKKAVYANVCNQMRNFQRNEQSSFVIPFLLDQEHGQKMFDLDTIKTTGSSNSVGDIIRRYNLEILTMLFADILVMGQTSTGSFALSGSKTNLVEMALEARLKEIASVIVNTGFRKLFELNGWDVTRLPQLKFRFAEDHNPDEFGKLVQRIASVNMMPRTPDTVAWAMKAAGYEDWETFKKMAQEDLDELFTDNESGAGTGMGTSGDGNSQAGGANSAKNADNAS